MLRIIYKGVFSFLCFFLLGTELRSQEVPDALRVQMFSGQFSKGFNIRGAKFKVIVFKNHKSDTILNSDLSVKGLGKRVGYKINENWERADSLVIVSKSIIEIKNLNGTTRRISGSLVFKYHNAYLLSIAVLPIDSYLIGVVDAELGRLDHPELWKAQAVLARTWIYKNHNKFSKDGFPYGVTDDVRSQAFHGWPQNSNRLNRLLEAVSSTSNVILADINGNPIDALFHANSGGQTMPCGWYFNSRPSLISVLDTFSLKCPQTYWKKTVNKDKWLKFISDSFGVSMQDPDLNKFALSFKQPSRVQFMEFQGKKKRLRSFREFFSLRSTWFSVENNEGDFITLRGRGYGHGIGMSQEGGLRMANFGYSADEILSFYYPKSKAIKF